MSTLPPCGPGLLQEGEALGPQGQLLLILLGQLQIQAEILAERKGLLQRQKLKNQP